MQLIAADVLAEANGLSAGAAGFALLVGVALWTCGWRWHRFWIVFGITTAAGVVGLSAGRAAGGQVMAIGLLLAFAGGVLALELARILAFAAGGVGAWLAIQSVLPQAQELWAVFLAGGLMGLMLYRLWTMLLTSLAGVLLAGHAGLLLAGAVLTFDAPGWAARHVAALNGAVVAAAVVGVLLQAATARAEGGKAKADDENDEEDDKPKKKRRFILDEDDEDKKPSASWWKRVLKAA